MRLKGRRVVLGVTGSVAAYKAAGLARGLVRNGAELAVVMTRNACRLVSPRTFRALGPAAVLTRLFARGEDPLPHVSLSASAEVLIIAPATANIIAKMACGIADDLLSTTALAVNCPVVVAPAMNVRMWEHPATRANVKTLVERGVTFVGPEEGELASGERGMGRMSEPARIIEEVVRALG